jgi:hypothetical protein
MHWLVVRLLLCLRWRMHVHMAVWLRVRVQVRIHGVGRGVHHREGAQL